MQFITDRKRAVGTGSARDGTKQHWAMTVSSAGLLILVPLFIFTFGPMLGASHADVIEYYARPFPAIVAGLTILIGFMHFKNGVRMLLEDYSRGVTREILIILSVCGSYAGAAVGLFALAKIAL
jgi:succinate dehydrogenase / fumarate reductase membrane anchor subunit